MTRNGTSSSPKLRSSGLPIIARRSDSQPRSGTSPRQGGDLAARVLGLNSFACFLLPVPSAPPNRGTPFESPTLAITDVPTSPFASQHHEDPLLCDSPFTTSDPSASPRSQFSLCTSMSPTSSGFDTSSTFALPPPSTNLQEDGSLKFDWPSPFWDCFPDIPSDPGKNYGLAEKEQGMDVSDWLHESFFTEEKEGGW